MARFLALPVTQGDAFYLKRSDISVLVDGGRSRHALPELFRHTTKADGVNILACSHNDAEHANGVLGFLESGLGCDELWLPASWLALLPSLLKAFPEVFVDLLGEIEKLTRKSGTEQTDDNLPSLEYLAASPDHLDQHVEGFAQSVTTDRMGWPQECASDLESAEPWEDSLAIRLDPLDIWVPNRFFHNQGLFGDKSSTLLWQAISAASRIRAIALTAYHQGVAVRWFAHDRNLPGGGVPGLRPLNARETSQVTTTTDSLLQLLSDSCSDDHSLVFWSPPTRSHPGALFSADADLATLALPEDLGGALITAPRHGSGPDTAPYQCVARRLRSDDKAITWIRSDGKHTHHPGAAFLQQRSRKFCTLCQNHSSGHRQKQPVRMFSRAGHWTKHPGTKACSCRA